ncbi:MAG: hypothetical protein GY792_06710 [Gammaproteobacteria bacterium]|nr:hypothetical protein [Gammaproteobacteria bacterium]
MRFANGREIVTLQWMDNILKRKEAGLHNPNTLARPYALIAFEYTDLDDALFLALPAPLVLDISFKSIA